MIFTSLRDALITIAASSLLRMSIESASGETAILKRSSTDLMPISFIPVCTRCVFRFTDMPRFFAFWNHSVMMRTERPYRLIDMNTGRTPATRMEWGSLEISESVKTDSERGYYYVGQHNLILSTPGNFECSQSFRAYCILFWCSESLPWNGVIKRQNKRSTFKFFEVPLYLKFSN